MYEYLLGLRSKVDRGTDELSGAAKELSHQASLVGASAVYTSPRGLCMAMRVTSEQDPMSLRRFLEELEQKAEDAGTVYILYCEGEVSMTPFLTLPHPTLYQMPEWKVLGAEVWPDARHPVLGVTLEDLAAKEVPDWGAFHSQTKAILDFSGRED